MFISYYKKYLIKKLPVPTKRATVLFGVKSCNAYLHMLLVCITIYLKSLLIYKFLTVNTYHPDTILTWARCEGPWLFFETKRFGKHWFRLSQRCSCCTVLLSYCAASVGDWHQPPSDGTQYIKELRPEHMWVWAF